MQARPVPNRLTASMRHAWAALLLVVFAAACGDDGLSTAPELRELDRAVSRWRAHGDVQYTMEQRRACFCARTETYRVTVVDDRVTSAVNVETSAALPAAELTGFLTVSQLFTRIRETLSKPGATVSATYDPNAGYPATAAFDPVPDAVDDEVTYFTSKVQPRPRLD